MKVLVGCEESQVVCGAFRAAGHESYSCDLIPTRGNPDWHHQRDVIEVMQSARWDLVILHPPCTALSSSGNSTYGQGMPKHQKRIEAIQWTMKLWAIAKGHSDKVALENPVGVILKHLDAPVFYLQPYEHGHGETKKTGFALHNLPPLVPTNIVEGRENRIWRMPPSLTRARDRSETYAGVALAMAQQWGKL